MKADDDISDIGTGFWVGFLAIAFIVWAMVLKSCQ